MNRSLVKLLIVASLGLVLLLQSNANGQSQEGECESGMCRSKWGFCGTGPDYCSNTDPQSARQNQGEECPPGMCRSKWGFCGTGPEYCEGKHGSSNSTTKPQLTRKKCPLGMCRSKWGYCGTGPEYCEGKHGSSNSTAKPQLTRKKCPAGMCRSKWGYCGTGPAYCEGKHGSSNSTAKPQLTQNNQGKSCPPGMCRSKWGFCGTGPEYCEGKHGSSNSTANLQTTRKHPGKGCPAGMCRSKWGYCGKGPVYCGNTPSTSVDHKHKEDRSQSQRPISRNTFIGEGTHYIVSVGYTACGTMHNDNEYIAALNAIQFDRQTPKSNPQKNSLCNKLVHVHGPNGSVTVKIVDKCRECRYGDLALSKVAFKKVIGIIGVDRVKIKWNWF
ncbi:unnamed protein product [Rotaria sordida]|uniref:Chitin-binding type-1 domain-containing protein n=1 Tax=Rotaria sordida TaxID=392033 RepID=A0A815K2Y1_9BILA|nr:unnamed protein product [Rotaria sordida]